MGKNGHLGMTNGEGIGRLRLRRILSVSETGRPVLDGTNARILAAGKIGHGDIGRLAVCQDLIDEHEHLVVVLGVLAEDHDADPGPLVIRNGEASLTLHPDGRIRMRGADIAMDAEKGFSVAAGRIDLN